MDERHTDGLSLRTYVSVLLRWKWVALGVVVVVTLAGCAYTWTRTPMYSATAQLLYVRQIDISNPLAQSYLDTSAQQAEIESAPAVVASLSVRERARERMDDATLAAGYSVSTVLQPGLDNQYTNVVEIRAESADPAAAADAANASAAAFVEWGKRSQQDQVAQALAVVKSQLSALADAGGEGSPEYKSLQSSLQQLELLQASTTGSFRVISPATEPSEPFSPQKPRGAVVSLALGLLLGIGLAFLLEQFDTRVRDEDEITELLRLPVIGSVPPPRRKHRDGGSLPTLTDPSGPAAEAFRLLRSNLDFVSIDGEVKSLLVTSSIQGEGKSVTACNLAVSMALTGKRVVLVDGDLRAPRVHAYVGVPNGEGLSSVMARRTDLRRALAAVDLGEGGGRPGYRAPTVVTRAAQTRQAAGQGVTPIPAATPVSPATAASPAAAAVLSPADPRTGQVFWVLPSGPVPPNPGEMIASARFAEVLERLKAEADIVLVDAPAMLPIGDVAALAPRVDALAFVVNPAKVRRSSLRLAHARLGQLPCRKLGVIQVVEQKARDHHYGHYGSDAGGGRDVRPTLP